MLALTFNGKGNLVTVTPWTKNDKQTWSVNQFRTSVTRTFSPASDNSLQVAMHGRTAIDVRAANSYTWMPVNTADGVLIPDSGGNTNFWGLANAVVDQSVPFTEGNGSDKQHWIFVPAS
ncbi:hypothetical protein AB1N83_004515 [Pleurotus pulmonarius]